MSWAFLKDPKSFAFCVKTAIQDSLADVRRNTEDKNRISNITYDELKERIAKTNSLSSVITQDDKALVFALPLEEPGRYFWRSAIKIYCRIDTSGSISSFRVMDLKQFYKVSSQILQYQWVPKIFERNESGADENDDDDFICCLCYDRVADVVLQCTHRFCQECIHRWARHTYRLPTERAPMEYHSQNRSQCPICRSDCVNPSTSWQLIEYPSREEFMRHLTTKIISLVEKFSSLTESFPHSQAEESPFLLLSMDEERLVNC